MAGRGLTATIDPVYVDARSIRNAYDIKKRIDLTAVGTSGSNTWTPMTRLPNSSRPLHLAVGCVRLRVVVGVIRIPVVVPFVVERQGVSG